MVSHTDAKMAVVLVERHKVHRAHGDLLSCVYSRRLTVSSIAASLDPGQRWSCALWAVVGRSDSGLEEMR